MHGGTRGQGRRGLAALTPRPPPHVPLPPLPAGRHDAGVPRSKRLLSDAGSNVLVYLSGHGGDEFMKFQDVQVRGAGCRRVRGASGGWVGSVPLVRTSHVQAGWPRVLSLPFKVVRTVHLLLLAW